MAADQLAQQTQQTQRARRKTILVVDDAVEILELMRYVLERGRHEVITASTGATALLLLQSMHIDLLITDLVMPGMSGNDLARRAKKLQPDLIVAYISGHIQESTLDPPMIAKPFRVSEVHDLVAAILNGNGNSNGSGSGGELE